MTIDVPPVDKPKTRISERIMLKKNKTRNPDLIKQESEPSFNTAIKTDYSDEINKIWERLNQTVSMVHNCQSCGATLEVEENKPIIHCKYCGNAYLVGAVRERSTY